MIPTPRHSLPRILTRLIYQPSHLPFHLPLWHLAHRVNPCRHQRIRPEPCVLARIVCRGFLLEDYILKAFCFDNLTHTLRPGDGAEKGEAEGAHAVKAANLKGSVRFGEAEVGIGGPVDFVPLEVPVGFCDIVLVVRD